jgi:hypothetical protein
MRRLFLLLAFTTLLEGAPAMSAEELTVRAVYSEFVVGSRVRQLMEAWAPQDPLTISISNVKTGAVREVLDTPLADLVTIPSGPILESGTASWLLNDRWISRGVRLGEWGPVHLRFGGVAQEDWRAPLRRVLGARTASFSRYASYQVKVSYRARQRQYRAIVFFQLLGGDGPILILDYILDSSTLTALLNPSLAEDLAHLPDTVPAERSANAKKLVDSVRAAPDCVLDSLTQFCCDAGSGFCGIVLKH